VDDGGPLGQMYAVRARNDTGVSGCIVRVVAVEILA
jgi:hypothetical protein